MTSRKPKAGPAVCSATDPHAATLDALDLRIKRMHETGVITAEIAQINPTWLNLPAM